MDRIKRREPRVFDDLMESVFPRAMSLLLLSDAVLLVYSIYREARRTRVSSFLFDRAVFYDCLKDWLVIWQWLSILPAASLQLA